MIKPSGTNTTIGNNETFLDRNAKLIPSDETTTALTNAKWIAGHHEVASLADLYKVYSFILSPSFYAGGTDSGVTQGADAVGQVWYVRDQKAFYQLIDWSKRNDASGWSKTNIKATTGPNGTDNTQYCNKNKVSDCIGNLTVKGDGTVTYTGYDINVSNVQTTSSVKLQYKRFNGNTKDLTELPNVTNDGKNGIISSAQYQSLLNRITYLEKWTVWQSGLGNNTSTYLWSGTLADFNKITNKPTDTTFIVTN